MNYNICKYIMVKLSAYQLKASSYSVGQLKAENYTVSELRSVPVLFHVREPNGSSWNNGTITIRNKQTSNTIQVLTGPPSGESSWNTVSGTLVGGVEYQTTK